MKTPRYSDNQPVRVGDTFNAPRWGSCTVKRFDRLNHCAVTVNTQSGEEFDNIGQATFGESDLVRRGVKVYCNVFIERHPVTGYWSAFVAGHGTLRADTLAGLKNLITQTLKP